MPDCNNWENIMMRWLIAALFCLTPSFVRAADPRNDSVETTGHDVWVSDSGSDSGTGLSPAQAVRTFERARNVARRLPGAKVIHVSGYFELQTPISLSAADRNTRWTGAHNAKPRLIAKFDAPFAFVLARSDNVTIDNLYFKGYSNSAIFVNGARGVRLTNNDVEETLSRAWSQAGIHLTGTVSGAVVSDNKIVGADYGGIVIDTDTHSDVSGIVVSKNIVSNTCRVIRDCGAIYVNDRAQKSKSIKITDNTIEDFGPLSSGGRGIYLDDFASFVVVSGNKVSGPGVYAVQIHSGCHNLIKNNTFDLRKLTPPTMLLFQTEPNSLRGVDGNIVENNSFIISKETRPDLIRFVLRAHTDIFPNFIYNKLCYGNFDSCVNFESPRL